MKIIRDITRAAWVCGILAAASCSNDPDDNDDPNPNPSGELKITSVNGGTFWGSEMTINGTGFSTVKSENIVKFTSIIPVAPSCPLKYTSDNGDIEIVSATETQLKIKVPVKVYDANLQCGPEGADMEITVKDKKVTHTGLKFVGLPAVGTFLYHYGWFDHTKVTKIDDSVMIGGGLQGVYAKTSGYWDKVRLSIDGKNVPVKYRIFGMEAGWAFFLPVSEFAEVNCSEDPDGWGARELEFRIYLEGTDKSATRKLYVQYLPTASAACIECPNELSKSGGGNPTWKIKGKNMYYTQVAFSPLPPCSHVAQTIAVNAETFGDNLSFVIPLSILTAECTYSVALVDACGKYNHIGNVGIAP